jgi:uncharacterized protein
VTGGAEPAPADGIDEHDGVGIVRRLIERVGALDIDGVMALLADDFVLELPFRVDGGPRRLVGEEAKSFIKLMPKLFSQLPFVDVTIHGPVPSGQIVAEYRSEGVTRNGRPYENAYVGFFEVEDGRVAAWREYFDPTVIATAFAPA